MKNFLVYSKKNLTKALTIEDVFDIRYVHYAVKLAYIFDVTGILYAFSRKLYKFGFILIALSIIFALALEIKFLSRFQESIIFVKYFINIIFALFATEIEEFFLKRSGYTVKQACFAKNVKEARLEVEDQITLTANSKRKAIWYTNLALKLKKRILK